MTNVYPSSTETGSVHSTSPAHPSQSSHARTVKFLSALQKNGYVRDYRVIDNEKLEEKCYFSCSQNTSSAVGHPATRARPREPDCLALCYIRLKEAIEQLDADGSLAGSEREPKNARQGKSYALPSEIPRAAKDEKSDARYRLKVLEGKYLYKARGRMAIAKYAEDASVLDVVSTVKEIEQRQEATPPGRYITRAEKHGLVKKSPIMAVPNYEVLYPLSTAVASRLHRFENHLVRIYGPTYRALQRIPEMFADGTQLKLAEQIYERALSGDGLALGQRLLGHGWEMLKKWKDGPSSGTFGLGGSGTSPGQGPPAPPGFTPPPTAPPPPPA